MTTNYLAIRRSAGRSLDWVAVMAGVSAPTVRLFEANPFSVTTAKREALLSVYGRLIERSPAEVPKEVLDEFLSYEPDPPRVEPEPEPPKPEPEPPKPEPQPKKKKVVKR